MKRFIRWTPGLILIVTFSGYAIYWDKNEVDIKLLATWPLSPNEPNKLLPAD